MKNVQKERLTQAHLFSLFDEWRMNKPSFMVTRTLVVLLLTLSTIQLSHADEINEFDEGSDGWTAYPSTIGRTSDPGWVNVGNDGEGSIRNNPTGTRYTYYWKLTKDIDLSNLDTPNLEVKYHFKGHTYDYFRIQIGEEGARRLSDFTVLHEATEATSDPSEVSIDLSEYSGRRMRVQFILRKPYDVVERRIGLYLHRAAIVTPTQLDSLDEQPGELRVSAFNIQVFGLSKMDKPEVVTALLQIISRFDLVMIQEIRDISETAIYDLLDQLNEASTNTYGIYLSERAGRTSSKEQIAFLYREDKLTFSSGETIPDPMDVFERPPVWAHFQYSETESEIHILGAHLDPDAVPTEIEALYNEFALYNMTVPTEDALIVMGDFNAGCSYLNNSEQAETTLFDNEHLISLINHNTDTTTTSTFCPYDRFLVGGSLQDDVLESGVYLYDQVLGLTGEVTRAVSDHYPVWARFDMLSEPESNPESNP